MERKKSELKPVARVVIADDHKLLRQVLELTLEQAGMEIVQAVSTGREAVDATLKHKPDLVLLDITMPDIDGLAALSIIKHLSPETCIIIISGQSDPLCIARAGELGAQGFFSKGVKPGELVNAIRALMSDKGSQLVSRKSVDPPPPSLPDFTFSKEALPTPDVQDLTEQEGLILFLISLGHDNQYIMDKLHISKNTLKTHTGNIFSKLGVSDRTQAAIWAIQHSYGISGPVEN